MLYHNNIIICILVVNRTCFLPWYEVPSPDAFTEILSEALPSSALTCGIPGAGLRKFLLKLWDDLCS